MRSTIAVWLCVLSAIAGAVALIAHALDIKTAAAVVALMWAAADCMLPSTRANLSRSWAQIKRKEGLVPVPPIGRIIDAGYWLLLIVFVVS